MPRIFERLNDKKIRDITVLADFVSIFCRENHPTEDKADFSVKDEKLRQALDSKKLLLCEDCSKLLNHGVDKLLLCPYDPKPMCKKCETHCYAPVYREKVREVMKFSGLYLVKHGRVDLMVHYFL